MNEPNAVIFYQSMDKMKMTEYTQATGRVWPTMSWWDLRMWVETHTPWWLPPTCWIVVLVIFCIIYNKKGGKNG